MPMNMRDIRELCQIFGSSTLQELALVSQGTELNMRQNKAAVMAPPCPPVSDELPQEETAAIIIKSPRVGRFLLRHPCLPDQGFGQSSSVAKGDVVAFLQVGPLLFPVVSEVDGVIEHVMVEPFQMIDFAAPLFGVQSSRSIPA